MQFRAVDVASGSERSNLDPAIARPTPIQFPPVTHVIVALCDGVRMTGLEEPWNRFLNPASYLLAHIEGVAPEATTGGGGQKVQFFVPHVATLLPGDNAYLFEEDRQAPPQFTGVIPTSTASEGCS